MVIDYVFSISILFIFIFISNIVDIFDIDSFIIYCNQLNVFSLFVLRLFDILI